MSVILKPMLDVIELTRKLVDIPSVTGEEREVGEVLYDLLKGRGWDCLEQKVTPDRFNVLATRGKATILLTTHMDTVPPLSLPGKMESLSTAGVPVTRKV